MEIDTLMEVPSGICTPKGQSKEKINFNKKIVAADLETMINPVDGQNIVYMAARYNGIDYQIFDIGQFGIDPDSMLQQFWLDLIKNNRGRFCYFHNFGGFDAILALPQLLNLPLNFAFIPIMKDGEIIAITVYQGTR